jgi:hypothetical protein
VLWALAAACAALSAVARAASAVDLAAAASLAALSAVACALSIASWLAHPEATPSTSTIALTFSTFLIIIQISSVGIKLQAHYFVIRCHLQRKRCFYSVNVVDERQCSCRRIFFSISFRKKKIPIKKIQMPRANSSGSLSGIQHLGRGIYK